MDGILEKTQLIFIYLGLWLVLWVPFAYADDTISSSSVRKLSMEEAVQIALTNIDDIQQAKGKVTESSANTAYIASEKKELESSSVSVNPGHLPVNTTDFLQQIPEFNQLGEEEQQQILQAIGLQIAINSSINQWIGLQSQMQSSYNQQVKDKQLQTYEAQLRSLVYDNELAELALKKTQQLVIYAVRQQYIQLAALSSQIAYQQNLYAHSSTLASDAQILFRAGRTSKSEWDQVQRQQRIQQSKLDSQVRGYKTQLAQLARELKLDLNTSIEIENITIATPQLTDYEQTVDLSRNYEIQEADAKIKLAKDNLTSLTDLGTELKHYYTVLWSNAVSQRDAIWSRLENRWADQKAKLTALYYQLQDAMDEEQGAVQRAEDANLLYTKGRLSLSELDKARQTQRQAEMSKTDLLYQYLLQAETCKLATYGVIL